MFDHVEINLYRTADGGYGISKTVWIGRHNQTEVVATFRPGADAKVFAENAAQMIADMTGGDVTVKVIPDWQTIAMGHGWVISEDRTAFVIPGDPEASAYTLPMEGWEALCREMEYTA